MANIDDAIAAANAEAAAKVQALVVAAKAEENAKALSGSQLSDEGLSAKLEAIKAANGASAPHPSFHALLDICKHLLSKVKALEGEPKPDSGHPLAG